MTFVYAKLGIVLILITAVPNETPFALAPSTRTMLTSAEITCAAAAPETVNPQIKAVQTA